MPNEVHQVDSPQGFPLICAGDPNGAIRAPQGTLAIDNITPAVWQNTNGITTWEQLGSGGGGGITSWGEETTAHFVNAGDPNGVVTAENAGDLCLDTDNIELWMAEDAGTVWDLIGPTVATPSNGQSLFADLGNQSGTISLNVFDPVLRMRLTGNVTISGFSNVAPAGTAQDLTVYIQQDSGGPRTVTWPASVVWAYGIVPVLSTGAEAIDVVVMQTFDGGTTWFANLAGKSYA